MLKKAKGYVDLSNFFLIGILCYFIDAFVLNGIRVKNI